jgi:hypothetical protein
MVVDTPKVTNVTDLRIYSPAFRNTDSEYDGKFSSGHATRAPPRRLPLQTGAVFSLLRGAPTGIRRR